MVMICSMIVLGLASLCQDPAATAANLRGIEKVAIQDFQGAAGEFRSALELDEECTVVEVNLVIACINAGLVEESGQHLDRLFEQRPEDPYVLYLSGVLMVRLGRPDEALRRLRRLLAIDPADPAVLSQLGLIEFQKGNRDEAAGLFRKALEFSPEDASALYNLARLLIMEGNRDEGAHLMRRFRELKMRPANRPMGGMGEPVVVPGKYARVRDLDAGGTVTERR